MGWGKTSLLALRSLSFFTPCRYPVALSSLSERVEEGRDIPRRVEHPDYFGPILEGQVKNHTGIYGKAAERAHARGHQIDDPKN